MIYRSLFLILISITMLSAHPRYAVGWDDGISLRKYFGPNYLGINFTGNYENSFMHKNYTDTTINYSSYTNLNLGTRCMYSGLLTSHEKLSIRYFAALGYSFRSNVTQETFYGMIGCTPGITLYDKLLLELHFGVRYTFIHTRGAMNDQYDLTLWGYDTNESKIDFLGSSLKLAAHYLF